MNRSPENKRIAPTIRLRMNEKPKPSVGEDSISSRKPTRRTNGGRCPPRPTMRKHLPRGCGCPPSHPHNSPAANYITFFFRKTNHISAGNISRTPRAHIAPRQAKNQKYLCTVGVFAGNIRLISEKRVSVGERPTDAFAEITYPNKGDLTL